MRRCGLIVSALLVALAPPPAWGQEPEWEYFAPVTLAVSAAALQGDHVWVGGDFGLMRYHPASGERAHFFTTNSGLPRIGVTAILAGDGGDLWVGTRGGGLALFDGADWAVYDTATSPLPSDTVNALVRGPDGAVWAGTARGLARIAEGDWAVYTAENSGLPRPSVTVMAFDKAGVLWLGAEGVIGSTFSPTLTHLDGDHWSFQRMGRPVAAFAPGDGEVWVGTMGSGACLYREYALSTCYNSLRPTSPPGDLVEAVAFDRAGKLWAAGSEGIGYWDGARWVNFRREQGGLNGFSVMLFAEDGTHWAAGNGSGLKRLADGDIAEVVRTGSHGEVAHEAAFAVDGDEVWVAAVAGVLHARDGGWTHHAIPGAAPWTVPRSVAVAPDGHLWAAVPGMGLYEFTGAEWVRHVEPNPPSSWSNTNPWSVAVDATGAVWVGGMGPYFRGEGVARYHNGAWARYTFADNRVWDIEVASDGAVWVATGAGAERFNGSSWRRYSTPPSNSTQGLAEGPDGRIWAATLNGLSVYDGSAWRYEPIPELEEEWGTFVRDVAVDRRGRVWAATTHGLAVLEGGAWTVLTPENSPIPVRDVEKVAVADDGTVWLSLYNYGMAIYRGRRGPVSAGEAPPGPPPGPAPFRLEQASPNPTSGPAALVVHTGAARSVLLEVYDAVGRRVGLLHDGPLPVGETAVRFDSSALPPGVYLVRATAGTDIRVVPVTVVR